MKIAYIGCKEIKGDNVAGTGLVWTRGQVHEVVDEKKCALLTKHSLIWADATGKSPEEIVAMLIAPPAEVPPEPRISLIPEGKIYTDPYIIVIDADTFSKVQKGELVSVFMTEADADAFSTWKKAQADTAPKQTGPAPKKKETKQGLDTKAGLEASKAA